MISKKTTNFNIDFLSKYWTKIWKIWKIDSRFEFQNVINFITNDENSNQFVKQTNVIFENSQTLKMIRISISNENWLKNVRRFWCDDIELIEWIKNDDRFISKINEILKSFRKK